MGFYFGGAGERRRCERPLIGERRCESLCAGCPEQFFCEQCCKACYRKAGFSGPASERFTLTLPDVLSRLIGESLQAGARQLVQDVAVLQEWQRARRPSHKIRNAMLKLGTRWGVPGKALGERRPPAEVAQKIEENMLTKAKTILRASAGAQRKISSFFTRSRTGDAQQLPATPPMQDLPLRQLFRQLNARQADFPPGVVQDFLEAIPVLLAWKRVRLPTLAQRMAMRKQACSAWKVKRTINKFWRPAGDIAEEWEALLVKKATELLNGSVDKHAHWFTLEECVDWVQTQCGVAPGELENEALTTLLVGIRTWLEARSVRELRKKAYAQQRKAINEEISGSTMQRTRELPFEIRSYAFTQHAVRELRAHTSMWADARKANAPSGLLGRPGLEHTRTTASDMMERQAHWPFHLAGDSGVR